MSRYNEKTIPYSAQEKFINLLSEILFNLKTSSEICLFLKDLLNRQERIMLVRRILIAEMLLRGFGYAEICRKIRCSSATVSRVARWLNFGRGGYMRAIKTKRKLQ